MKETTEPAGPFGAMPQEPWHPGKGARVLIALSNSTAGKCTLMQVLKKQNMEELQQQRNKPDLPFRQTMINS